MLDFNGVYEENALVNPQSYHDEDMDIISWDELKGLKQPIIAERLRFVSDFGYPSYDLSYLHVRISGKRYEVINTPFDQIPKRGYKQRIYGYLQMDKIFIKDLFGTISILQ